MDSSRSLGLADKVNGLFGQTPASLLGNLIGALILSVLIWDVAPPGRLFLFIAAFSGVWVLRIWLHLRFLASKDPHRSADLSRRWLVWWNAAALISGMVWGAAAWAFYPEADTTTKMILVLTVYSFCLGSIPVLATQPRVFVAFALCCFVPLVACVATQGGAGGTKLAIVLVLVFVAVASLGHRFGRVFDKLVRLKARAEQLSEALAAEKASEQAALADLRRAQQERADFIAALDREMRQPLAHVLAMALEVRLRSSDPSVVGLARGIQTLVTSLESVAGELQALSHERPDARQLHRAEVQIGQLWDALKLDHEPQAFEKRVSIAFRGHRHRAFTDPVMLDRLLRQVLACALATISQGGIIVAARPQGDQLRLQVWDTAESIDPAGPAVSVSSESRTVREELGPFDPQVRLRLSAVAHQASQLGASWRVVASPGRGCLFELRVPLVPEAGAPVPQGDLRSLREAERLRGVEIVVVDDEPASREELRSALCAWSAKVLACSARDALASPLRIHPHARLAVIGIGEDEEDRLPSIVSALREAAGEQLPVLVVAPAASRALVAQALAARFHLLARPLRLDALWSLVHFKLGMNWTDRDPTFTQRLGRDGRYWAEVLGTPRPTEARLQRIAHRGHHFQPASRMAMAQLRGRGSHPAHVVMVHGGLSSVRVSAGNLLCERAASPGHPLWQRLPLLDELCAWRFEHDSFMPIASNVRDLVRCVERQLCRGPQDAMGRPLKVALVAHSRGGVVARLAAAHLQQRWPQARFRVYTFGSPHGGTWVFRRIGERWSRTASVVKAMRGAVDGVAKQEFVNQLDIVARAFDYDIPVGFRDVEPGRVDRLFEAAPAFAAYTTWSSRWTPGPRRAPGFDLLGQLVESVSGFEPESDGLVSAASANGAGLQSYDSSPLFHTDYFSDARTMAQLNDCLSQFFLRPVKGPSSWHHDTTRQAATVAG